MKIYENEPLLRHTTFRVGGPAWRYMRAETKEELANLVTTFCENNKEYLIIGNGSNLLVSDKGFDGAVISLDGEFKSVSVDDNIITAGAGMLLSQVAAKALENSLTGMEFAAGIPGTIGGAMVMNAGAYGGEMKDIVVSVTAMDENGHFFSLSNEEMCLGYRTSIFKFKRYVITEVKLKLSPGDGDQIKAYMDDLSQRRREKQPLEYPSAGSTFKRPEGHFAGKLIEDAGLKGFSIGGACVSDKHCGFVVNKNEATADDIYQVIRSVQKKVKESSGVSLETEVIMIGDFE